jgi:pyruvate/2-oxoglutarate dehydrogenase complex dihydrolipoamide acyltransferase (E2) component
MEAAATEAKPRRRWGDRYDGRRIRTLNPFYQITPYIMRTRVDAQDYFEDRVDIAHIEAWLKKQREAGYMEMGYLHVFIAAMIRLLSQRPRLNRFIAGQKIYARNGITVSLALKKKLNEDSPETTVKMRFNPEDTIYDVLRKVQETVNSNKAIETSNSTDKAARLFMLCPGFIVRFLLFMLRSLDWVGLLPKAIHKASPFHTSFFITDLGSLGIKPIYHHLYDFGTTSIFMAFGAKERHRELNHEGKVVERKFITMKVVNDERICDGHYYASAFKLLFQLFKDPSALEVPPERVVLDQE